MGKDTNSPTARKIRNNGERHIHFPILGHICKMYKRFLDPHILDDAHGANIPNTIE